MESFLLLFIKSRVTLKLAFCLNSADTIPHREPVLFPQTFHSSLHSENCSERMKPLPSSTCARSQRSFYFLNNPLFCKAFIRSLMYKDLVCQRRDLKRRIISSSTCLSILVSSSSQCSRWTLSIFSLLLIF